MLSTRATLHQLRHLFLSPPEETLQAKSEGQLTRLHPFEEWRSPDVPRCVDRARQDCTPLWIEDAPIFLKRNI